MIPEHRILYDEEAIQGRIQELSRKIAADLEGRPPVVLGLMMGSFVFLGDLVRGLSRCGVEPRVDLLDVSHYGMSTDPGGDVRVEKDTSIELAGEAVLVVDDILDSGRSLTVVLEQLNRRQPAWLRICVFLDKPSRRKVPIEADYVGFTVPDEWIIGYGLDLRDEGRALPYVAAVERHALDDKAVEEQEERELA